MKKLPIAAQMFLAVVGLIATWWLIIPKPSLDELSEGRSPLCPTCFAVGAYSAVLAVNLGLPFRGHSSAIDYQTCDEMKIEVSSGASAAFAWYEKKGLLPSIDGK